jgi:hypothetical protein
MKNGFSLCYKNDKSFVVSNDGTETLIGNGPQIYNRNGNILYKSKQIDAHNLCLKIYLRDKFLSEFEIPFSTHRWLLFKSLNDDRIEIAEYWSKGNFASNVAVYTLTGDKIQDKPSYITPRNKISPGDINKLQLNETSWKIENNKLSHNSEIIFEGDASIEELYTDGFFSGVANIIEIIETDIEFGSAINNVGYIDINGNKYWEN